MTYGEIVGTIWRQDRKRSVVIMRRVDFFTYREEGEDFDLGEAYWTTISGGGLFATAAEAEAAARLEVPWLRDQISN